MTTKQFDLEAGALSLDFANTLDWHASDNPEERLRDPTDLIAWGEAAGLLSATQGAQLRRRAESRPDEAARALAHARQLREAIYRIFAGHFHGSEVQGQDLAVLNGALQDSLAHLRLVPTGEGFGWEWAENEDGFEQIIRPVARQAGELLTSDLLERVSQCADDRGCGYLFVDTSRNRSRRWCSMETCGNRAKARRHYRRQQEEDSEG